MVELGCEDEIPTAIREVEAAIIHQYGEDKAAILAKRPGLSETEASIAITYRFAQVASMLGKKPQIEAAKRELEELSDGLENSTIWQYLVWRCLTLSGEKEAAKAMLERLLDPATKDDFMQFRYLRKRVQGESRDRPC